MTTVTLVYPYFQPSNDNSIFRFPPLGLGYIAAYLKQHGISVEIVDCTFLSEETALKKIRESQPKIIGIQSMFSMKHKSIQMAQALRKDCELLVTGGALPTSNPTEFLRDFDVVVIGEGEQTMLELVQAFKKGKDFSKVDGIAFLNHGQFVHTPPRDYIKNLDNIPFPSHELFDNQAYKNYYARNFGYTTTSIMTSRGCPFQCDFCSRPVFGNTFRTRTASNIADEVEQVRALGFSRVWFADDCFTLDRKRLLGICNEFIRRHMRISWECLSRVDTVDAEVAETMKQAGCVRVFFGLESGNDFVLSTMKKQATTKQGEKAVNTFKNAGVEVGAFFILGYPGENEETVHDTVQFASSLPLDYLSFTLPYPIPGTPLFDRVKHRIISEEWVEPKNPSVIKHSLTFESPISETKLKVAIVKGMTQHYMRKYLGNKGYCLVGRFFEHASDAAYKIMR